MNMGSQNVIIPGLTLLNSLPSTHLPPVAPLTSVTTPSPAQSQASTPANPQHTPGGKKRQAALRRQTEVSNQAAESSSSPPSSNPSPRHKKKKSNGQEGRQVPSAESGGVPNPHPLYLAQSLAPPLRVPDARRILVIMDLNGTLLYRPNKRNPFNFIQRPHARSFMQYCLETFHVAIWSSARPENVGKMVAQLLTPAQRARLVVIWARDRFGLSPADYDARVQCYKRLTSIWSDPDVAASHPLARLGHRWDQTNTILVDDSIEKARSEPHNLLEIPEFSGVKNELVDVLPQVHDYLNQCCYQADVSRFIRQNPFKLDLQYGARY
ncbi:putative FCP1-like protein domain-containing protein [Escovopsis weberi]|uniref:Mitochondrial import inner membrane translocase subunit TIM50 n=1 Tax=Escovopsis weberi TaxID=150374 RepID=A0A0M9VTP6_ESCWE|nr:putative FCP1-like protein domain-containing protein [Escovopsis weberi]